MIGIPVYSNHVKHRIHQINEKKKTELPLTKKRYKPKFIKSNESYHPLRVVKQGGQPLSSIIRSSLELLFDYNFNNTRIHVGDEEAE